ncbi:RraA family protein [Novosphingobium sp. LASN5T]|uniref:RraA family protein n=1 Tax=Novosphingobium sp. LASN5T TaxID=2491021 RepID=UPI000F5F1459|nr:RraA family protein [Novosphingobium sp. LASN5T]RQW45649.1 RraA family protein [Novosphingobium sp. LASN5T]
MTTRDFKTRLLALDTPTLSDALDALGLPGAIHGLLPLTARARIAGRVRTVRLGAPVAGRPKVHLGAGAIVAAKAGDIIVVEHRGRVDVSGWGGLLSRGAIARGIEGVIVDGAVRDIDEASELGFPVYARAGVPVTARGRVAELAHGEPITVAGLAVREGDWVIADASGVVFLAADSLEKILAMAERIFAREQMMARDIAAGVPIDEVMGTDYEDMLAEDAL